MQFIRPKIIGTLRIRTMMAGNLAVVNGVKNSRNKIIIQCRSDAHGQEIIETIKNANPGDRLFF